jgi:hypothetical protein
MRIQIPLRTVSEGNVREHWAVSAGRHKRQKEAVREYWLAHGVKARPPCTVRLTRMSARMLDDDNLRMALKWIRDAVAECLVPGLAVGRADDSHGIAWQYAQVKGKMGVVIEVLDA